MTWLHLTAVSDFGMCICVTVYYMKKCTVQNLSPHTAEDIREESLKVTVLIHEHQIFITSSIKEIWQQWRAQEVHGDTMKCCISNHLYVWRWGKKILSVSLLGAFLEYLSGKLLKFTFFSASTFSQPALSTSTLDNYLLYFPEFHSTAPGEQAWTCCIQLSYVYCMCG